MEGKRGMSSGEEEGRGMSGGEEEGRGMSSSRGRKEEEGRYQRGEKDAASSMGAEVNLIICAIG